MCRCPSVSSALLGVVDNKVRVDEMLFLTSFCHEAVTEGATRARRRCTINALCVKKCATYTKLFWCKLLTLRYRMAATATYGTRANLPYYSLCKLLCEGVPRDLLKARFEVFHFVGPLSVLRCFVASRKNMARAHDLIWLVLTIFSEATSIGSGEGQNRNGAKKKQSEGFR